MSFDLSQAHLFAAETGKTLRRLTNMAKIEKDRTADGRPGAEGQAHRRDPELRQPGNADRHDHRRRRRGRHRLQLHDRHRRLVGDAAAVGSSGAAPDRPRRRHDRGDLARSRIRHARDDDRRDHRASRSPPIDTALWDLRAKKQNLPLWKLAGGAKDRCPLYTTEGGWLHIETQALVDDALAAKAKGFRGSKVKIGKPHGSEDLARLSAVREAVGDGFEIMTDCQSGLYRSTRRSAAPRGCANSISPGSRSRCRPTTSTATSGCRARRRRRSPSANRSIRSGISANTCRRAPARSCRSMSAASAASRPG